MITDHSVFEDAYRPRRLLHRDQEISQLSREFHPIVDGDLGGDALISGPSGVGKTLLARHTLDRFETTADVAYTHLRCLAMTDVDQHFGDVTRRCWLRDWTPNSATRRRKEGMSGRQTS
jgi:Cdc6-like AAA superfamily ATPase